MSNSASIRRFEAERVATPRSALAESPVWHQERACLYWVDIVGRHLFQLDISTGCVTDFPLAFTTGCIVPSRDGHFAAGTERGFAHLELCKDGPVFTFGFGPELGPKLGIGWRMNDGACDPSGRFWSGSLSPTPTEPNAWGELFSLEPDGGVTPRGGQFRVQNGLAWSPDGRKMYVSDSHISNVGVTCYRFDPETGDRANPTVFADYKTLGGRPDGAAIDVDGCYWIAASDSGRVLRLTPEGRIDAEIQVPVSNPTNICFAGRELKTAYITSLEKNGTGGDIFAVELPFQGIVQPLCSTFRHSPISDAD